MEETSRLPEGIEWPRYESGELVGFGDEYVNAKGNVSTLRTIAIKDCRDRLGWDYYWKLGKGACAVVVKNGERVKRPPVIAGDGEPLEAGQTVWHVVTGREYTVRSCTNGGAHLSRDGKPAGYCRAEYLTHQRPVLDADGVPIREGDTVYLLPGEWCGEYPLRDYSAGDEMVVKELYSDHEFEGVLRCAGDGKCVCFPLPCQLTHTKPEPPDSWDSVWMDVSNGVETPLGMERRCRALAERGE